MASSSFLFNAGTHTLHPLCPGLYEGTSNPWPLQPRAPGSVAGAPQPSAHVSNPGWVTIPRVCGLPWPLEVGRSPASGLGVRQGLCLGRSPSAQPLISATPTPRLPHGGRTQVDPRLSCLLLGHLPVFRCFGLCACTGSALSLPLWAAIHLLGEPRLSQGPGGRKVVFTALQGPQDKQAEWLTLGWGSRKCREPNQIAPDCVIPLLQ